MVSSSGIPGVGVVPGFFFFFSSDSLGMPGIGPVGFGNAAPLAEIPGMSPVTGTGLPERPGGMFAGSSFTSPLLTGRLSALVAVVEFVDAVPPHAPTNAVETARNRTLKILIM